MGLLVAAFSSLTAQEPRERATLEGHLSDVCSVAFSPDGKVLASASLDRTIKLWDVSTAKLRASIRGQNGQVKSVAFSPDGTLFASGATDTTIKLWDVSTGELRVTLRGHTGTVSSAVFSPDGKGFRRSLKIVVTKWDDPLGGSPQSSSSSSCSDFRLSKPPWMEMSSSLIPADLLCPSPSSVNFQKYRSDCLRHPLHPLATVLGHFAEGKKLDIRNVDCVFDFWASLLSNRLHEAKVFFRLPKPSLVQRLFRQSGEGTHFGVDQSFSVLIEGQQHFREFDAKHLQEFGMVDNFGGPDFFCHDETSIGQAYSLANYLIRDDWDGYNSIEAPEFGGSPWPTFR
jgi:WD domain, G-beta repeat